MKVINGTMPDKWLAKWINPELPHDVNERQPASVLRRRFTLDTKNEAKLFITCHGLYVAEINGMRVGEFVLAPGTGDYNRRLTVQAYDVSSMLRIGENEIVVTLGDGWYRGHVGIDGLSNYYGSDIALLCQLEMGGKAILVSDENWEGSQSGPTRLNDLQIGEDYDARMEQISDWHAVSVLDFDYDNLAATQSVPILEQERFPGRLMKTPNGETIIDFGQNLAGYTELRLTAKAGQRVSLWHGETLDENGNFTQSNYDPVERNKGGIPQRLRYVCKDGLNTWRPSFTIFGFRYAKIETEADLSTASFTAVAVYSQMPQTGYFTCGNEDVNRLFLNSLWSMRSNFCDIPTDCPTRERAGWTGDAGAFAPTAVYLADCYPVLRKWLGECRLAQGENGLVQNIAPVNNSGSAYSKMIQGAAGWGDACIIVPWALYEAYGDTSILEENYDMMCRWLEFCGNRAAGATRPQNENNPWKEYLADQGFHFGEWCQPDVDNAAEMQKAITVGVPEVATAYYFRSASLLSIIAGILGKAEDGEKYLKIAENVKKAYRFTCTSNGKIESERQCEYVRPIAFGLLEGDEVQEAADTLDDLVVRNGYHLNTGFLSTPYLCSVLADNGHVETAYKLLLQEDCPGWLYAVKHGATTVWETWDAIRLDGTVHDSFNHYSYGAISGWLFSGVCGIRLSAGRLTIQPKPHPSLGFASAVWESPYGRIESSWKYEGDRLVLDVSIPDRLESEVIWPDGSSEHLCSGKHHKEIEQRIDTRK